MAALAIATLGILSVVKPRLDPRCKAPGLVLLMTTAALTCRTIVEFFFPCAPRNLVKAFIEEPVNWEAFTFFHFTEKILANRFIVSWKRPLRVPHVWHVALSTPKGTATLSV